MTPPAAIPPAPRPGSPRPEPPPPLRVTRRGMIRLAQLGATAGALGVAAVSCGIRLDSGGPAVAAGASDAGSGAGQGSTAPGAVPLSGSTPVAPTPVGSSPAGSAPAGSAPAGSAPDRSPAAGGGTAAARLPGVGPSWTARLAGHDQVVLVSATAPTATRNLVRWFDRAGRTDATAAWTLRSTVVGWNGAGGWTADHTVGDGHTPVGIYPLTDAGGFAPDPGTALPYQYSPAEYSEIVNGVRTFRHVLAIDYNRVAGTPPSDTVRPDGWSKGGSIWVHVEHGSPTQACVGIPDASLVALLRWLRPAAHPVILMGPAATLAT